MNPTYSTAGPANEYQPTIIEAGLLIERLAVQIAFLREELKRNWIEFKRNPASFLTCLIYKQGQRVRNLLSTPYFLRALSTAITAVVCVVVAVLLFEKATAKPTHAVENTELLPLEIVMLNVQKTSDDLGIGRNGTGRVGFQSGSGEGSGPTPQHASGGGSSGDRTPLPSQGGEAPPPSPIPAAIPITPPLNPPVLPAAGIDIDPALWQDLKEPVYGDPFSMSHVPSKGPGTGEGIGTRSGTGVGDGFGPGVGPGTNGNMGTGDKQIGGSGPGGSTGEGGANDDGGRPGFGGGGSLQRARVLSKPEPQYTEDARKNQVTGTVVLRVVFASSGEVVQIRAVHTLPFGLTERAIAAARQIKFEPAMRDGRAISVSMQLEYNFNLY
jgi:TonB family protein